MTQEDFEFAVAKVRRPPPLFPSCVFSLVLIALFYLQVLKKNQEGNTSVNKLFS